MLFCSQCIRKCSTTKDLKQECWIVGLKEGASLEKAWTEEVTEFHWSDLIGFLQMTLNWANGHWGLSDWAAAGPGFLSFSFSLKPKFKNKILININPTYIGPIIKKADLLNKQEHFLVMLFFLHLSNFCLCSFCLTYN